MRLCCPHHLRYYGPLRLPSGPPSSLRLAPYRLSCPDVGSGARCGSPQFRDRLSQPSVPSTPTGSSTLRPGLFAPSMAFALFYQARLPLVPLFKGFVTMRQGSLDVADGRVARALLLRLSLVCLRCFQLRARLGKSIDSALCHPASTSGFLRTSGISYTALRRLPRWDSLSSQGGHPQVAHDLSVHAKKQKGKSLHHFQESCGAATHRNPT